MINSEQHLLPLKNKILTDENISNLHIPKRRSVYHWKKRTLRAQTFKWN